MWSQLSNSQAAQSERESKEIKYALAVNVGFVVMALVGLYLDSFKQCCAYYRRWSLLNQELVVFPYDKKNDIDYCCNINNSFHSSPSINSGNTSRASLINETLAADTPNTSPRGNVSLESCDTTRISFKNDGFACEVENFPSQQDLTKSSGSTIDQSILPHQSMSTPVDVKSIFGLKETYV